MLSLDDGECLILAKSVQYMCLKWKKGKIEGRLLCYLLYVQWHVVAAQPWISLRTDFWHINLWISSHRSSNSIVCSNRFYGFQGWSKNVQMRRNLVPTRLTV